MQCSVVRGVIRRGHVVANRGEAVETNVDELWSAYDQPERLPNPYVIERREVGPHDKRRDRARLRLQHAEARVRGSLLDLRTLDVARRVKLTADERVEQGRVVLEIDDG